MGGGARPAPRLAPMRAVSESSPRRGACQGAGSGPTARPRWRGPGLVQSVVLAFVTFLTLPASAASTEFEFALLGDPQIGFGPSGEFADYGRLRQVLGAVQGSKAELVVVAGDLVQSRRLVEGLLVRRALAEVDRSVLVVPGNHDVVDGDSLHAFREDFGGDHFVEVRGAVAFVGLDSETARKPEISEAAFELEWDFIERSMSELDAEVTTRFLVMHRPPFIDDEHEEGSEANWPLETRARLLALSRQHGFRHILAGHLHRTHAVRTVDGIEIVVLPGTARSFDRSALGYERFVVQGRAVTHEFVRVAPAPSEPPAVAGLRGWTPRLLDPSPRHWLFTLLYGLAGYLALRRARRDVVARRTWQAIGGVCLAFGANFQLDLDEAITEVGRVVSLRLGFHALRHSLTAVLFTLLVGWGAVRLARARERMELGTWLALAALSVPLGWFCLSAMSHHDLGMILTEDTWDVLHLIAIGTVLLTARARPARGK